MKRVRAADRNVKLLHMADIHIGVESYGRPATSADLDALPDTFAPGQDRSAYVGINTRLLDFLAAFDEAVEHALTQGIDAVIFAGDAYKSRDPSQTHQREFAKRVARLADGGVPVFLTVGNHDLPHIANRATALEIFPTLSVERVVVSQTIETHVMPTAAGPLQVVALPWVRIGQFMAREETRDLSLEQIKEEVEQRLSRHLAEEVARLDPALPAVLCAHVNIAGATAASERSMMLGNDHMLGLGTVAIPQFDYVALGNIHKHQVLAHNPPVIYSGSIERVDFSEESEDKGFVVVDLDESAPQGQRLRDWRFVAVDARPMLTISVKPHAGEDPTDAALEAIGKHVGEGLERSIVRVRVEMEAEQEPAFRETAVRQALSGAFYVAGVERRVHREHRTRIDTEEAERLTPMAALHRYLESRGTASDREAMLTAYAERLIQEEVEGEAPEV